jgi:hypothetical protein
MTNCLVFIVDLFASDNKSSADIRGNWDVWALRDRILCYMTSTQQAG